MTDERNNELWAILTPDERESIVKTYEYEEHNANLSHRLGFNEALEWIFGYDNLNAPTTEEIFNNNGSNFSPNWEEYRMELVKELALAIIKGKRWDFQSCNPVEIVNNIIKELKNTKI